jgi:hypothetical protein
MQSGWQLPLPFLMLCQWFLDHCSIDYSCVRIILVSIEQGQGQGAPSLRLGGDSYAPYTTTAVVNEPCQQGVLAQTPLSWVFHLFVASQFAHVKWHTSSWSC